jgi:hypothetical protein
MRHWILLPLLTWGLGRPTPASAASLSVTPEAPCLQVAKLTALVERELDAPLAAAVPLRFEVTGAKRARGYDARVDVFDDRGAAPRHRVVEAADCATLEQTVAIAITLALSADAGTAEPASTLNVPGAANGSGSAAPAAMLDAPREPSEAIATAEAHDAWIPSFSAGLLVDAGTLPSASLGAAVGAALSVGRIQFQALGTLLFDREFALRGRSSSDAAATLGFVGASLLGCTPLFQQPSARLSSRACLGWELGQLTGEGTGVARPRRGHVLWSAPRVDLGGRVGLTGTPWGLGVSLSAEAPLNRDEFTLGQDAVVHRLPAVVARAAVGVDVAFE